MNRFGLRAEIHYLRGVPNNQVAIWLNASDLVLLTSFHEGSPTIIKEALACNLPIVSVDVGDVAERIQGIEGCYIALSEPVDIAAKLSLVYNGPRRIAGRVKVQELSLERVSQRLKETYHEILTLSANESVDQEALWKSADRNGRNRFMSAFRAMKLGKSNGSRSIAD
jgi:glycosyltransferase involved in cell wall biosynthesis